ncbi:SusD/RagB family nutrient-binding outer membrane lipoprotein [Fulvivirga sp. M361]|uniref:SusD/RagB family nutrient-binding outer membrane lipoprotein n=1 Tax=Fulvivirga sp. M361 TaxID=2594266 RepID=UPI00117AB67E|nr:SusD/RagB family nutrient-binding outer membrane lipoprotein [Fulvivirga sp. M361]TRX54304.1 SusD/RagB family nutrient-binding outer membrane lipoprotein [Fulvivirga sp. M361]
MKKIIIYLSVIVSAFFASCEVIDFDLQNDPNRLLPDHIDPDFLLNAIQIRFEGAMNGFNLAGDEIMRYEAMNDTYTDEAEPAEMDNEWNNTFSIRENLRILEDLAAQDEALRFHKGIGTLLSTYSIATLVDYLGDIPFSESNKGVENLSPKVEDDAIIYPALLEMINIAIDDFRNADRIPTEDLFYNGDTTKWIRLANTLKFKLLLNTGDVTALNELLDEDNLVSEEEDDFQFPYSTAANPVESRHAYFNRGYDGEDGQGEYIGNYFIWLLKESKSVIDPRLRFYLFRQTNTDPPANLLGCIGSSVHDFCYTGDFYWGRDHGDDTPRAADRFLKTVYGMYPAGGAFDGDNPSRGSRSTNMGGAGILPILMSFHVEFFKAEAVLRLGANGDAAASLEAGVRESINKVLNFSTIGVDTAFVPKQDDVEAYVTNVMDEYALAGSDNERLNIVIRELYIATLGNSVESYKAYRRTGFPEGIQEPIINENVPFPRTFALPEEAVNANTSLKPRPITNQVFWDTNPGGFIN